MPASWPANIRVSDDNKLKMILLMGERSSEMCMKENLSHTVAVS